MTILAYDEGFRFGKTRKRKVKTDQKKPRAQEIKDPKEEPPFYVKGQEAASKDEYWMSLALEKVEAETGWGWAYQVPVYGGRRLRGGQVVDFILYTPGKWTVIDVRGKYWHTGHHEDSRDIETVCRKKGWNLIWWFTDETPSKEMVYQRLRKELHL